MCSDPEEFLISKSEYAKWINIKEFLKTKRPLVKYDCNKKSGKFNLVNGITRAKKYMVQMQILYTCCESDNLQSSHFSENEDHSHGI